ncbi:MAG: hypothetical protein LBG05_01665 [Treponema sp.]|jgi:hypothetical protein|nr:hypothetical protein [Treponema sp.]
MRSEIDFGTAYYPWKKTGADSCIQKLTAVADRNKAFAVAKADPAKAKANVELFARIKAKL